MVVGKVGYGFPASGSQEPRVIISEKLNYQRHNTPGLRNFFLGFLGSLWLLEITWHRQHVGVLRNTPGALKVKEDWSVSFIYNGF